MAPAAYVNAIRRMSAVLAVLLGRARFREADWTWRLTAALLACLGAAWLPPREIIGRSSRGQVLKAER